MGIDNKEKEFFRDGWEKEGGFLEPGWWERRLGREKINHQRHFSTGSERGHRPSKTSKDYVIFLDLKFDFFKKKGK